MKGRVITDGNPEDERDKVCRCVMDPTRITNSKSLKEAIDYFSTETRYIDEVIRFDYFEISGKRYSSDFWLNQ